MRGAGKNTHQLGVVFSGIMIVVDKNIVKYQHTQVGLLLLFTFFVIASLFWFILKQANFNLSVLAIMLFILFIIVSFTSLKVTIDENYLQIKFGYGIFRKKFLLKEIISARAVRNHWYYGWGIRFWLWPRMVIFNISGFDAVEIKMKNEKIYRIGTDEPKNLESAINIEIQTSSFSIK